MKRKIFANLQRFFEYVSAYGDKNAYQAGVFIGDLCCCVTAYNKVDYLHMHTREFTLEPLTKRTDVKSYCLLVSSLGYYNLYKLKKNVDEIRHCPLGEKRIH